MRSWKTSLWGILGKKKEKLTFHPKKDSFLKTESISIEGGLEGNRCKDSHPLHPRVLEDLCSAEAQRRISNQQLGDEIFGPPCDVSPVLVWKLILPLLDTLKQLTLRT